MIHKTCLLEMYSLYTEFWSNPWETPVSNTVVFKRFYLIWCSLCQWKSVELPLTEVGGGWGGEEELEATFLTPSYLPRTLAKPQQPGLIYFLSESVHNHNPSRAVASWLRPALLLNSESPTVTLKPPSLFCLYLSLTTNINPKSWRNEKREARRNAWEHNSPCKPQVLC